MKNFKFTHSQFAEMIISLALTLQSIYLYNMRKLKETEKREYSTISQSKRLKRLQKRI